MRQTHLCADLPQPQPPAFVASVTSLSAWRKWMFSRSRIAEARTLTADMLDSCRCGPR
ncbi:hypothetical protein [Streptomyces sp. NPDC102462]|uniref:hypothetical protein n=1 Tax=Streptomyces sp. NPDC102462 TaxID=3366178 RepID=UPI0037F37D33